MPEPNLTPTAEQTKTALTTALAALQGGSAPLPTAWKVLVTALTTTLQTALGAGTTTDYPSHRDLAIRLYRAGRNACMALAHASTDMDSRYAWQAAGSSHQALLNAVTTGWPRTQTLRNPALPLEYNNLPTTPKRPLINGLGESLLATLLQDPLGVTPTQAQSGLVGIPAAVYLSGTFEA